jgi:hypothetical protein
MSLIPLGILAASKVSSGPPSFLTSAPLWLDAADASTITESSGSVSEWGNKGTLENFTQAVEALQPLTGSATINSLNAIQFNADSITGSTASNWTFLNNGDNYFYAMVLRTPSGKFLDFTTAGSSASVGVQWLLGNEETYLRIFRGVSGSFLRVDLGSGAVGTTTTIYSGLNNPDSATVSERAQLAINDGTPSTNAVDVLPSTSDPSIPLGIGFNDSRVLADLGEVIIVSGANATESNRQKVLDYLNAKWSVF